MSWTRREFLRNTSLVAAASGLPLGPLLGAEASDFKALRRGVGTYTKKGGTIGWLVRPDALVVVDSQFPDSAKTCLEGLKERSQRRIDVLINSHHHGDHTAGNATFSPFVEKHVAHENVPALQKAAAEKRQGGPEQVYAGTTYSETWKQGVGDEIVHLSYHGPAHTGGDSVIYFEKADVVHMGDLMFNRMPAFIDRPAGANIQGWIGVVEKVHGMFTDETLFIYGHGGEKHGVTGARADLLVMRDFLTGLLDFARQGIAAGQSEDEVAATKKLEKFPDHFMAGWADGISMGLRAAYQELTGMGAEG
jgi:glyoxylase-like metal-dependent hydrolase (beta-lactamase superfamily II)